MRTLEIVKKENYLSHPKAIQEMVHELDQQAKHLVHKTPWKKEYQKKK